MLFETEDHLGAAGQRAEHHAVHFRFEVAVRLDCVLDRVHNLLAVGAGESGSVGHGNHSHPTRPLLAIGVLVVELAVVDLPAVSEDALA